jgi:hypothetical protein
MKRMVVLSLVTASLACAGGPASARDGWNAAGAILGAAGGFALGSALANPYARPVYGPPPGPVYVEEGPACYVKVRRYVDEFGDLVVRKIRVCE